MKTALTIAGSDSGGGAGIQADLKAFSAQGVFGMSVITAVTAQNTREVRAVQNIDLPMIEQQIEAVFDDIKVDAVKIGMLGSPEVAEIVAKTLQRYEVPALIVDPVMVSKAGHHLLPEEAIETLKKHVLPLATLVTPNVPEAEVLTGMTIETAEEMEAACKAIYALGAKAVLLKGGHLEGDPNDVLYDGQQFYTFKGQRIHTKNTHGTGCTLASAITANMAKGKSIEEAVQHAKTYITHAITHSLDIGQGHGPVHHFYAFDKSLQAVEVGDQCE